MLLLTSLFTRAAHAHHIIHQGACALLNIHQGVCAISTYVKVNVLSLPNPIGRFSYPTHLSGCMFSPLHPPEGSYNNKLSSSMRVRVLSRTSVRVLRLFSLRVLSHKSIEVSCSIHLINSIYKHSSTTVRVRLLCPLPYTIGTYCM